MKPNRLWGAGSARCAAFARFLLTWTAAAVLGPGAWGGDLRLLVGSNDPPNRILEFDGRTGQYIRDFVTPGGGGLSYAQGMAYGPDHNVYVADFGNDSIKRYDGQTGEFLGDFVKSGVGGLSHPDQLIFGHDGLVYVSNRFSACIKRYYQNGDYKDTFVSETRLSGFVNFTFGPDKNIYAGMFNPYGGIHKVLRFSGVNGAFMDEFATSPPGQDSAYAGLEFGDDGNLYAARMHSHRIERYDGANGEYMPPDFVPAGSGGLSYPRWIVFGPEDRDLYVGSQGTNSVLRYDGQTGAFKEAFTKGGDLVNCNGVLFIPEPATLAGLAIGLVTMFRRRPIEGRFVWPVE